MGQMKISQSGIDLIKKFEGLRLDAYQCAADVWTIGYGTTRMAGRPVIEGDRITESQAEELLRGDIAYFEQRVNELVTVPITQSQFDALVSLAYNIGDGALASSTLLRELNAGNYQEAGEQFLRWNKADGQVLQGLVARRTTERNLFFSQAAGTPPQGSPDGLSPQAPAAMPPAPRFPNSESEPNIMPLPVAALVALGTELVNLIPWVRKNQEQANKIVPKLVEVAKSVVPEAQNEQAAVEKVLTDPAKQDAFRSAVAAKWSDIAPFLEYEAKEREAARGFAERMTEGDGPAWRQIGFGILLGTMSLTIVVGGGAMFWQLMSSPQLDPGQKGLILGALIASFTTVVGYFFGSSATSRQKDITISEQAKK